MVPLDRVYRVKVKEVGVGIVMMDFKNLRDETPPGPSFHMDNKVEGIADIGLDGPVGKLDTALQNATGKARQALLCRIGVNGGKRPGMPRIEKLQEIEGFAGADFTELREGYLCCWCELKEGHLSAITYPNSSSEIRRFPHPQEAEIVGRVTGVAMRIAEASAP